jgi:glutaredoxin
LDRFEGMETQVLGLSVDSVPCLKAWAESLGGITYPLLSDFYPHGQVAEKYGVLRSEGYTERAIFVLDKRGIIRYIDVHDIEKQPDNDELFRVLNVLEPELARKLLVAEFASTAVTATSAVAAAPAGRPLAGTQPRVVLYCTSWCPDCRRARAYLKDHNIDYLEIDVGRDREAAARLRGWANGNETTPTFDIGGKILLGYDTMKLNAALGVEG